MKRRIMVRPQFEAKLTCYLSKGNFRLKAENIEFTPKRVRVSEAAGREGVSLG